MGLPSSLLILLWVGVASGRGQLAAPAAPGAVHLAPSEIEIYRKAPTLIEWNSRQVKDKLGRLRPADNQDQLPTILERTGQTVAALLRDFPRVTCDEDVISESKQGVHESYVRLNKFRYIVIPHPEDALPTFEEYRTDAKGNPLDKSSLQDLPFLTYNFASTTLLLSPSDQRESRFRYFRIQSIRGRKCHVVGFAQNPENAHRLGRFTVQGKSCVLLLQGVAWVDAYTFDILQMNTWLLAPRMDIGLDAQFSHIEFYPTKVGESKSVMWLPRDVKVSVICLKNMSASNTHHYKNYKLFSVESTIKP
jgi:hypothetical protein